MSESEQVKPSSNRKRWIKIGFGVFLGALAGFAYFTLVGCTSGG